MSKSLGNVIDPLGVIKDYGTDALRFTMATGVLTCVEVDVSVACVCARVLVFVCVYECAPAFNSQLSARGFVTRVLCGATLGLAVHPVACTCSHRSICMSTVAIVNGVNAHCSRVYLAKFELATM